MNVIYDTGSDWVVLEGSSCANCKGNTYDPTTSNLSNKVGSSISTRHYGTAVFYGTEYTDKVCINPFFACVENFEYFQVTVN